MDSKRTIYSATVLTFFSFGFTKTLQFASNLILTRLLYPEAFGLIAIVTTLMVGLSMFSDVGINFSVIQSNIGDKRDFLLTAWTIKIIRGAVLCIVAWALAWPISVLYDQPLLFPLILICSFKALFDGFHSILLLKFQRELELKRFVGLQVLVQSLSFCITIVLALLLKSVWALALGSVATSLVYLYFSHCFFSYKHVFTLDKEAVAEIVKFGKWLIFATMVTFAGGQGLKGIEGYLIGVDVLGFLFMASLLSGFVSDGYQRLSGQVVFPYFSKLHRLQDGDLDRKFRTMRLYIVLPSVIVCGVISVSAPYLVEILYDQRYQTVSPLLSICAINVAIAIQPKMYMDTLLAKGKSKMQFYFVFCNTAFAILATVIGFYSHGVLGMLVFQGVASSGMYFFGLVVSRKTVSPSILVDLLCWGGIVFGVVMTYRFNFST